MINTKLQREKVHLARLGREVFLNPISIADDEWMGEQWDTATMQDAFTNVNVDILFAIFWRLLDDEGKRLVAKATIIEWDGLKEKQLEIEDPVLKLKKIVAGGKEILEIMKAIFETRRKSNPEPAKNEKKSLKEGSSSPTPNSMISSPASTVSTPKGSVDTQDASSQI